MRIRFDLICIMLLLFGMAPAVEAQVKKMKIYISVDMEGVVGVVTADQLTPTGFEYARFREIMTREAKAE